jgi:multidrug efflux pump subunit AcrB
VGGRRPRGLRRVPVPPGLARDSDLGCGDPAVRDPDVLFLEQLGFTLNFLSLLALSLVAGVPRRRRDRGDREHRPPHADGQIGYQASIDAADEIGLAVLATTMAIVAVFLPVGLMPGISGQFFKNFGFTVGRAVLMSLFVGAPDHAADGRPIC